MAVEKTLKSEDRVRKGCCLDDPVVIMERLGFDNYAVDWEDRVVFMPLKTLHKIANFFGKQLLNGVVAFGAYGWTWELYNDCPKDCPQELCSGNPYHETAYCELKEGNL